ncbi:MAG: M15 family metallopeptidase [Prevotella sp.]|nr:M15 family metallopeptidase [Prevotella sp.]
MRRFLFLLFTFHFSLFTPHSSSAQTFTSQAIPDSVFQRMQGRSYPEGCSVRRSDLRYLRLSHYDAQGREHVGEMVCNKAIAQDLLDIFRELYRQKYPIERIRLIDDYGADDERSMRANNTSSFCYRKVSGTSKLSKHAMGMAVDINTLYNPYVRTDKKGRRIVEPATATAYTDRTKSYPYKIVKGDLLYRLFIQHGFRWGGNWRTMKDWQHFEK